MAEKNRFVFVFLLFSFCYTLSRGDSHTCYGAGGLEKWMGDGACDPQNLIPECEWDGGDCCRCTCQDKKYVCGSDGFMCIDPGPFNDTACEEVQPPPCPVAAKRNWVVENTTQVRALAETVNCSGGSFEVEWRGSIIVDTEIAVVHGTFLNITGGMNFSAVLDGESKRRLFRVVNASLQLNDVEIINGNATFGGAIAAIGSFVHLNRVNFANNTANDKDGGAMFVYGASYISFSGDAGFFNNTSKYNGGAVYVAKSSISWIGMSYFSGNSAYFSGGALCAENESVVSWAANTTFKGNEVDVYGGAVSVDGGSNASWSGGASFVANNAGYQGGAVYVDSGGNASWSAGAIFFGNDAEYEGGAVFIDEGSYAFWSGISHFSGNTAHIGGGGAVLIGYSSKVIFSGKTTLINNTCGSQGGAVSSRVLDSSTSIDSRYTISSLYINGSATFAENTCGSYGGGLAMLGGLSAIFKIENFIFIENKAGVSGGAVYISATSSGPSFTKASFLSNTARVGGGVFIAGSGMALNGDLSAMFDECMFIGNTAEATGGAVDIATGSASFVATLFKGNVAWLGGGAIRISGTANLDSCVLEENMSKMDGDPAIMMIGSTLTMQNCSFRSNAYDCDPGTYLGATETGDGRFAVVCSGCGDCTNCTVEEPGKIPKCLKAMDHSDSPPGGNSVTLETLFIDEGYWRAANNSITVLACYNKDACKGGVTGSPGYCHDGYTGPYCAVCTENNTKGLGFTCSECSDNAWGITGAAVAIVVSVFVVFAAFTHLISPERAGERSGITAHVLHWLPIHSLKIIIVAWQILTQFTTVANITYPEIYQRFLKVVDILNFDPTWMLSVGCVINVDFHGRFLIVTVGPILVILILLATYTYIVRKHDASEELREIARNKHLSTLLFILFLVYSSTSSVVLQMFICDNLDDGNIYLQADYTIECDELRHQVLMVWAGFAILVYPVGIPLFFAFLLFKNRSVLLDKNLRENNLSVVSISDLWKPYKPIRFYYEVIEFSRRIVLIGVLMVIEDDSAPQVALALMFAFVFAIISEWLAPYESLWDAWITRLGHAVVFFSMYYALLLKVNVSDDSHTSQTVFDVILVCIHVLMILLVVAEATMTGCTLKKREVEDPWPRNRLYRSHEVRTASRAVNLTSRVVHGDEIELSIRTPR